jgi:hypothetical protein
MMAHHAFDAVRRQAMRHAITGAVDGVRRMPYYVSFMPNAYSVAFFSYTVIMLLWRGICKRAGVRRNDIERGAKAINTSSSIFFGTQPAIPKPSYSAGSGIWLFRR